MGHKRSSSGRACGSVKRKLDSRWTLIQENEMDLIFVDENEIIYPKRINVDKGGFVDFSGFKLMFEYDWLSCGIFVARN